MVNWSCNFLVPSSLHDHHAFMALLPWYPVSIASINMYVFCLGALGKSGDVVGIQGAQASDNSVSTSLSSVQL